ncbi:hypothetical protein D3C81_2296070 [compost metagenome]
MTFPVYRVHLQQGAEFGNSGVVDQCIKCAEVVLQGNDSPLRLFADSDVGYRNADLHIITFG